MSESEKALERLKSISSLVGFIAGFLAVVVTVLAVIPDVTGITFFPPRATPTPLLTPAVDTSEIEAELINLHDEVAVLQQRVDALSQVSPDTAIASELSQIHSDFDSVNERLGTIEQVILDNPAKALEVTLLSKDMENLQQSYQADLQTAREEIGRIYDLNKWFLGLMFTMAIGLISLAISNFIVGKPSKKEEGEEAEESKPN